MTNPPTTWTIVNIRIILDTNFSASALYTFNEMSEIYINFSKIDSTGDKCTLWFNASDEVAKRTIDLWCD